MTLSTIRLTVPVDDGIVVAGGRSGARQRSVPVANDKIVLTAEAERFERRLTEEITGLRTELHDQISAVRTELRDQISGLRAELHKEIAALRLEMHDGLAAVRQEMHAMRADILKWSFLFWIGQVATMAALLSFMLRAR